MPDGNTPLVARLDRERQAQFRVIIERHHDDIVVHEAIDLARARSRDHVGVHVVSRSVEGDGNHTGERLGQRHVRAHRDRTDSLTGTLQRV